MTGEGVGGGEENGEGWNVRKVCGRCFAGPGGGFRLGGGERKVGSFCLDGLLKKVGGALRSLIKYNLKELDKK